jgi:CPA2 family monovalent cation:H+ antiporter-2
VSAVQDLLTLSLLLLVGCGLAAMGASYLRVPTVLGYLAVAVLLGPSVLGWVGPGPALSFLSEVGVVLLLFIVGLEFSVRHFWATRKTVLTAGILQMGMIGVPVAGGLVLLGHEARTAALLGAAATMSSTALVAKQLSDQGELTTRHGQASIAVLVFQDLATIPLLALLAIWSRGGEPKGLHVIGEVARILLIFVIVAASAKRLLHGLLAWVVRRGNEETFVLISLAVVIGAATGARAIGVSAAVGAFLAGMVLGESDFRHQMEDNIRPFRDVLSGLFFVTIGLQLDASQILAAPLTSVAWLVVLVPLKILLNGVALRAARLSPLDAWRSGIILGHGGEFALLMLSMALKQGLFPSSIGQPALLALVVSMAIAPLLVRYHEKLASRFVGRITRTSPPQAEEQNVAIEGDKLRDHVVICGAGKLGQIVSRALTLSEIPHLLIESDYEQMLAVRAMELPVFYGDASRVNTLRAAGVAHAHLVVITFSNTESAIRIGRWLHHTHPSVPVIVSCDSDRDAEQIRQIPGVRVYIEHLAAGLTLAEQAMLLMGVSAEVADRRVAGLRNALCLSGRQSEENVLL